MWRVFLLCGVALGALISTCSAQVRTGVYSGTAKTTVEYIDYYHDGVYRIKGSNDYGSRTTVVIASPKQSTLGAETNPFSLRVRPTSTTRLRAFGNIFLSSAHVASSGELQQAWKIWSTEDGFAGELLDNFYQAKESPKNYVAARASLRSDYPAFYRMDDGSYYYPGYEEVFERRRQTVVSATITGKTLKMTVYGHSYTGLAGREALVITNFVGRRQ